MNQETIHILMIDDDEEDFIIIRDLISIIDHYKYTLDWVSTYEEGHRAIKNNMYDVYLIDFRLGPHNGLELIEEAISGGCQSPLILITGQNDPEIDKKVLKAGAADYLVKGTISTVLLDRSIRYSVEQSRNIREITQLNEELENKVKERTLALEKTMADLEQSKTELKNSLEQEKELNEMKSRFVSMASHEFRTPLATILSSLSLVSTYAGMNELEKQAKHIKRIRSAVTNMTEILNDVLSLSKLEEGKMLMNPEPFKMDEFIEEIIQEVQVVKKPDQTIHYVHSGNGEIIHLDKKIIRNILFNLMSNAIKFSNENSPINITTVLSGKEALIEVQDHGIGISVQDQKHLFERFFRASNATNIQGTGLGLNIVAKYVEMLNGTIRFRSTLGEGTTFTVRIPVEQVN